MVGVEMTPAIAGNFHSPTRPKIVTAVSGGGLVGIDFLVRLSIFRQIAQRLSRSRK